MKITDQNNQFIVKYYREIGTVLKFDKKKSMFHIKQINWHDFIIKCISIENFL